MNRTGMTIKRIFLLLLAVWVAVSMLTGCGEQPVQSASQMTTSELMAQYGPKERFTVWIYRENRGQIDYFTDRTIKFYDAEKSDGLAVTVEEFFADEYAPELFSQKLSAALMSGKGPDLIFCNTQSDYHLIAKNYFEDMQKAVANGAFSPWDEMKDAGYWEDGQYFDTVWDAAKHTDGKVYALPVGVNYGMLRTKTKTMQQLSVTDADFADSNRLLSVIRRLSAQTDTPVCFGDPAIDALYSGIFDYTSGKTNLLEEPQRSAINEWSTLFHQQPLLWKLDCSAYFNQQYDATIAMSAGKGLMQLFLSGYFESVFSNRNESGDDIHEDFIAANDTFYPLCDENGDWVGEVVCYAMIAQGSAHKEEVYRFMQDFLFGDGISTISIYGYATPASRVHYEINYVNDLFPTNQVSQAHIDRFTEMLEKQPKRLFYGGSGRDRLRDMLTDASRGKQTVEKTELALNIYLSE